MTSVFIGLGSNLVNPREQLRNGLIALTKLPDSQFVAASGLYHSLPMGPEQPDYVNAVARLETTLQPLVLLDALQGIEQQQGRVRDGQRWGPRTLDLDLLLYGQQVIRHPRLTVPHYGLTEREFVVYPLAEIAPQWLLPDGRSIQQLTESCPLNQLRRLSDPPLATP